MKTRQVLVPMASFFCLLWIGCASFVACSPSTSVSDGGPKDGAVDTGGREPDGGTRDAGGRADSSPSPVGVYALPLRELRILPDAGELLALPYVDGVLLDYEWSTLEAEAGSFTWTDLEADLAMVEVAGKKAEIAISAGMNSPSWVCQPGVGGAQCLHGTFAHTIPGNPPPACTNVDLPLPWDAKYQGALKSLVTALVQYLTTKRFLGSVVTTLKISGINIDTTETLLPANHDGPIACDGGDACMGDKCTLNLYGELIDAGFTGPTTVSAFVDFAAIFRGALPNTIPIGSQISHSLPSPGADAGTLPFQMAVALVQDTHAYPITVQDDGLTANAGTDPGTLFALEAGVPVGYQMLGPVSTDRCRIWGSDAGCPSANVILMTAIQNGIDHGARWLEIYSEDLMSFPEAGAYAHASLSAAKRP